ncbi:MAG: NAD-dependent epimerase/dehydratase family protein [Gemmatimonadota bacterium]
MRVLITGGTGFIGSALARRLCECGHDVRVLSLLRDPVEKETARRLRDSGIEVVEGDVADRSLHSVALEGVEIVHHVAAAMREAGVRRSAFWDTNVAATRDLVEESRARGVARFVYCSTMGVTGGLKGQVVDESAPYRPKDIYTRTKAAAEKWILEQARATGFPAVVVRPADVYGPGDRRLLKLFRLVREGRFFYLGAGRGRRHMVFIEDLLDGMIRAQEVPEAVGEVFLLAGPSPVRLCDLVELIARELDVAPPRRRLPYRPVWLLSGVVEAACRPFRISPPIYPRRIEFYAHDYAFDTSRARLVLGYDPRVDMVEGVRRTIRDYREKGLLA